MKIPIIIDKELLGLPVIKYDGEVEISNYRLIVDINSEFIETNNFIINGEDLKIKSITKDQIRIQGKINNITIKG